MPFADWSGEVKTVVGGVVAAVLAGLGGWASASRARKQVSGDSLEVHKNASRGDWIDDLEAQVEHERKLRQDAEKGERHAHEQILVERRAWIEQALNERKAWIELSGKVEHLERLIFWIAPVLVELRPEFRGPLNDWLTESGLPPLDALEPKRQDPA